VQDRFRFIVLLYYRPVDVVDTGVFYGLPDYLFRKACKSPDINQVVDTSGADELRKTDSGVYVFQRDDFNKVADDIPCEYAPVITRSNNDFGVYDAVLFIL
jgi:hypothetical protein